VGAEVSPQTVGAALLLLGVVWLAAAWLIVRTEIRSEARRLSKAAHPANYSMTIGDDHHITVWERLPLHDWSERGEL
jgi:hypothetical protein